MKTFTITIKIDHTDKRFNSTEIQVFINSLSKPETNWVKTMKQAFKDTLIGHKAENISVEYAVEDTK